jgi:hypothetical protein
MKFLFFLLFIPSVAFSQSDSSLIKLPIKDGKVVYELIVETPTISKAVLFGASKKWIADTFNSAKAVTQSEDFNSGQIIGKFYNESNIFKNEESLIGRKFDTQCSVQIDVKDGKCRIRFYDIIWLYPNKDFVTFKKSMEDFIDESEQKKYSKWFNKQRINLEYYGLMESYKKALLTLQNDDF